MASSSLSPSNHSGRVSSLELNFSGWNRLVYHNTKLDSAILVQFNFHGNKIGKPNPGIKTDLILEIWLPLNYE